MQTPIANATQIPLMEAAVRFFQQGGLFMIPIALILLIGLAIVLERMIYLQVARRRNRRVFESGLWPLLQKGEFHKASKAARESGVEVGEMVAAGLARFRNSQSRSDVEYAMEEGLMEVLPRFEKRTPYLATLANVATLLGLLGTIMGLISAFTAALSQVSYSLLKNNASTISPCSATNRCAAARKLAAIAVALHAKRSASLIR